MASEPGSPATGQAVRAQNFDLLQGFKTGHTSVTADDDKGHPPQSAVKTQGAWTRQLARCHLTVTSRPAEAPDTSQHRHRHQATQALLPGARDRGSRATSM